MFLGLHQFSSVTQLYSILCDTMDCSTPGIPVHHQLLELAQTHVHRVGDAIQPSHPLTSPSLPIFNLAQNQGLFELVSSSHQVAKVLELQLQHQSFLWIFRTDLGLIGLISLQSKGLLRVFCNSFHTWYFTRFNAILPNLPTLSLSHRVHKTVLYISVSFAVSYTGLLLPSF